MRYKAYRITDGYHEMLVVAETRSKATGVFIEKYGFDCDWKRLRTKRSPDMDSDREFVLDWGAFCTVEYWGAPVRM